MKKVFALLVVLVVLVIAAACNSTSQSPTNKEPKLWTIPSMSLEGDGYPPPAPDLCTWATSVDAIIWGTLKDIRFVESPLTKSIDAYGGWVWTDNCEPMLTAPAVELELSVDLVLKGQAAGDIIARMGLEHYPRLEPMPVRGSGGKLEWESFDVDGLTGPLLPGQPMGIALHRVEQHQSWSLMGEVIFSIDKRDGRIFAQRRVGELLEPVPLGLEGTTVDALANTLAACQETPGTVARRNMVLNTYGPGLDGNANPARYWSAYCRRKVDDGPSPGTCQLDSDCPSGEVCRDGNCTRD